MWICFSLLFSLSIFPYLLLTSPLSFCCYSVIRILSLLQVLDVVKFHLSWPKLLFPLFCCGFHSLSTAVRIWVHSIGAFIELFASMAEGTRFKVLDEFVKTIQESQTQLQKDFEDLNSTILGHQNFFFQEVLFRLATLGTQIEDLKSGTSTSKPTLAHGSNSNAGFSLIGRHKPTPVELSSFSGDRMEAWVF